MALSSDDWPGSSLRSGFGDLVEQERFEIDTERMGDVQDSRSRHFNKA